ncbi:MAG: adenylosuccinate lyase [Anaerolineales bacterium]|nr:adenylosuccinate lyase [Anaerolineales bacterium]
MDYKNYLSPFSWRYGSSEMRQIWSEHNKRLLWRSIWVALAETQAEFGLVTQDQIDDLRTHQTQIDVDRAVEIEAEIRHDVMAEIKTYAEQCPIGGSVIHLGATSMDVVDNTDALRVKQSLTLVLEKLELLLTALAEKIGAYANLVVMGHTHIQPAEPTTLGYRLAQYGQDFLLDYLAIAQASREIKGKGFKGAVGTGASYSELIGEENLEKFEQLMSSKLDIYFFPVATQTYPRKQDYQITNAIAGLGASVYKMAFDLRILQSPPFGELSEQFGKKQVGSSAMPFKRNPVTAEKINSLGRALAQMPRLAWDNAAHSLLERTLDDSANRRSALAETFLICDELLQGSLRIVQGLQVNLSAIQRNLETYGPFAATERVLMALGKKGADRQAMHEYIRRHSLTAWEAVQQNKANPLTENISQDPVFLQCLSSQEIYELMEAKTHIGFAPARARQLAQQIKDCLEN